MQNTIKNLGKLIMILSLVCTVGAIAGCDWNEDTSLVHIFSE